MLPFEPETLEQLQARYPDAILENWLVDDTVRPVRPGSLRTHVFDGPHGIRLIISRDTSHIGKDGFIHVSASLTQPLYQGPLDTGFISVAKAFIKQVTQTTKPIQLLGVSNKGIPHFKVHE